MMEIRCVTQSRDEAERSCCLNGTGAVEPPSNWMHSKVLWAGSCAEARWSLSRIFFRCADN